TAPEPPRGTRGGRVTRTSGSGSPASGESAPDEQDEDRPEHGDHDALDVHAGHVALVEDRGGDVAAHNRPDDTQDDRGDQPFASTYDQIREKPGNRPENDPADDAHGAPSLLAAPYPADLRMMRLRAGRTPPGGDDRRERDRRRLHFPPPVCAYGQSSMISPSCGASRSDEDAPVEMTRPGRLLEEGGRGTRRRTVPAMVRLRGQPTAQRRSGRPRRPEHLGQRTARPMAQRWAPRSERLSRMEYKRQGPQRGRQLGRRWRLLGS